VPTHAGGDVLARFRRRAAEVAASAALLDTLLPTVTAGTFTCRNDVRPTTRPITSGIGIVEGWRGTIVHRVEIGAGGLLRRVKVVGPSFHNWPALPVALTDTIVADFPLVNKRALPA